MNLFTRWKEKASNYIDVRLRLFKLSLIERTSKVLSHLLIAFTYLFLTLGLLIFVGFGLMEVFSSMLDSRIGGAFLTAGLFAVFMLILLLLRKKIASTLGGFFVRILTEGDDDDDEEENAPKDETRK